VSIVLAFCITGVMALCLTMRTLWHLGWAWNAMLLLFEENVKKKFLFMGFGEFCTIFD